jgi:hypothetical protein
VDTPRPHDLDSKQGSDPIASLGLAKQLIREAQAAIEEASDSVVLQQVSSAEFPIFQLRLAQVENEKAELGVRLVEMEHQMGRIMTLYVATYQLHATLDPTDVQTTIGEISTNLLGAEQFALLL